MIKQVYRKTFEQYFKLIVVQLTRDTMNFIADNLSLRISSVHQIFEIQKSHTCDLQMKRFLSVGEFRNI